MKQKKVGLGKVSSGKKKTNSYREKVKSKKLVLKFKKKNTELVDENTDELETDEKETLHDETLKLEQQNPVVKLEPIKVVRYKPTVDKTLVVLLVEETSNLLRFSNSIYKILDNISIENYLCIIRYGIDVNVSDIDIKSKFDKETLKIRFNTKNDKRCLYDALSKLSSIVSENLGEIIETETTRYMINKVEVIGIGTCCDDLSDISKEAVTLLFDQVLEKNVRTRYFCTDEMYMQNAAELGFRAVACFNKKF